MLNAVGSPRDHVTGSCWHRKVSRLIGLFVFTRAVDSHALLGHLVGLSLYKFLQNLHLRDLWIPIIHHLIQKLVCDNEVVSQAFVL